jgi:zinc resistance-associated protein
MKRTHWITWAVALLAAASMAFGQGAGPKNAPKGCPGIPGLSEDQQKKVQALDLETEKALLPLKAQMDVKAAELRALALAENPEKGAIDKKIEEIGLLRTQIMKKKIMNKLAVRALMTPDQRIGFDKMGLRGGCGLMECCEEGRGPEKGRGMMMKRMRHGGEMMRHQGLEKIEEKEVEKEVEK